MICNNCKKEIQQVLSFCPFCGMKIDNESNIKGTDSEKDTETGSQNEEEDKKVHNEENISELLYDINQSAENSSAAGMPIKQKNNILKIIAGIVVLIICAAVILFFKFHNNYSKCFSVINTVPNPTVSDSADLLFRITNETKKDGLKFIVIAGKSSQTYRLNAGETQDGKVNVRFEMSSDGNYADSFEATYAVYKDNKEIWSKTQNIPFDTKQVFVHKGTIVYSDNIAEIELVDHQANHIDLTGLFENFDPKKYHRISIDSTYEHDIEIQTVEGAESKSKGLAFLGGIAEITGNPIYNFNDDFKITIDDTIAAADVNWAEHINMLNTINREVLSSYLGIYIYTLYLSVENVSDEDIYATVTDVYINETPLGSGEYCSDNIKISPGSTDKLYGMTNFNSTLKAVPKANSNRFGLGAVIKDGAGNELYRGVFHCK